MPFVVRQPSGILELSSVCIFVWWSLSYAEEGSLAATNNFSIGKTRVKGSRVVSSFHFSGQSTRSMGSEEDAAQPCPWPS